MSPPFTYEQYCQLSDDRRCEVLFTKEHGLGRLMIGPFDVILSNENVVQPDILFVCQERLAIIQHPGCFGVPDLVVEVLVPERAETGMYTKRRLYGRCGVREYWIVDPNALTIEVLSQQGDGLDT